MWSGALCEFIVSIDCVWLDWFVRVLCGCVCYSVCRSVCLRIGLCVSVCIIVPVCESVYVEVCEFIGVFPGSVCLVSWCVCVCVCV